MARALSIHSIERASQRAKSGTGIELCVRALEAAEDLTKPLIDARIYVLETLPLLRGAGTPFFTHKSRRFRFSIEEDGLIGVTTLEDVGSKVAVIGIKGMGCTPVVITFLPKRTKGKSKTATPKSVRGGGRSNH